MSILESFDQTDSSYLSSLPPIANKRQKVLSLSMFTPTAGQPTPGGDETQTDRQHSHATIGSSTEQSRSMMDSGIGVTRLGYPHSDEHSSAASALAAAQAMYQANPPLPPHTLQQMYTLPAAVDKPSLYHTSNTHGGGLPTPRCPLLPPYRPFTCDAASYASVSAFWWGEDHYLSLTATVSTQ